MKKTVLLILILTLCQTSMTLATKDTWIRKTDMLTARSYLSASVVDGKIYAIGGLSSQTMSLPTLEVYDPVSDTWARKADMPTPRLGLSTNLVLGRIYAIGGLPGANVVGAACSKVEEYDPVTNTWTGKADMPTARLTFASEVVDGKIYTIGGHLSEPGDLGNMSSVVEVYDPVTDAWTRKADMPTARTGLSAGVVEGKIYVIGGTAGSPWNGLRTVEVYNPSTDTWEQKADMPTGRYNFAISVVKGKIYAIGGVPGVSSGLLNVEVYDPTTDIWEKKADMLTGRLALTAGMVDGKIYAIGGCAYLRPFQPVFSTVEEYDTGLGVPSSDFNGDGVVDCLDMCILVEHWQSDYPPCDIAPPPFGDGIVDVQDLIALSEHLFEQVNDPTLIAHWPLDETEGIFAADSVGDNDAVVLGGTEWQPDGGQLDGALSLDGVSGYALAGAVLNPTDGPFSVLTWINGGAPGQVVVSQQFASNWLAIDAEGNLMTELKSSDPLAEPLVSETIITDGQWHRIGFVWDGSHRTLYVDGVVVAEDTQDGLAGSENGLNIGAGQMTQPGTFFSGLIDDVRIYNRAVSP